MLCPDDVEDRGLCDPVVSALERSETGKTWSWEVEVEVEGAKWREESKDHTPQLSVHSVSPIIVEVWDQLGAPPGAPRAYPAAIIAATPLRTESAQTSGSGDRLSLLLLLLLLLLLPPVLLQKGPQPPHPPTRQFFKLAAQRPPSLLFRLTFGLVLTLGLVLILALPFPALRAPFRLSILYNVSLRPFAPRPPSTAAAATTSSSTATNTAARPLTTHSMAPGQFQKPPQPPPLFTGTADSIVADTQRIIDASRGLQDQLAREVRPEDATFENVLLRLAHDEDSASLQSHILGFYQAVSSRKELRDASTRADEMLDEFGIESSMREDIFALVDAVYQKREQLGLGTEEKRLVEKERRNFIKYGLGLEKGAKRDRFKEIKLRLSQLAIQFQKNLNEENGGLWYTPAQLEGVPEDVVSTFQKGEGENEGKLRVTFKYPDLFPVSKYAKSVDVRKEVFIANENKVNANVPLFRESVLLRDEAARLLGYPNHATFRIEDKMAKTPKTVLDFLGDLRQRLTPGGGSELNTLKEIKKGELQNAGEQTDGHYYLWDHRYYARLQLERDYQLDQQKVAEYFPLQSTLSGMLQIFEELLGLQFFELTGEDRAKISPTGKGEDIVWHEDVQLFSVWDDKSEGEGFVGYLYTDLHPREGKYGHAANFNMQPGFIMANGTRRYPATSLVCNFSKPTVKKPSLLKHDEVVTLFHELGHGIHDLVSRTKFSRFHGTSVVQDFVEAPSQMLENWCWTPSQLRSLSRHYSSISPEYLAAWKESAGSSGANPPPREIPDDLINSIVNTKHINDAIANLRQLHFGIFDMTVHTPSSRQELEDMDFTTLYNKLRANITLIEGPEALDKGYDWGHGQATFGHLIGGYDAGYYGYLSSQVYSMDMFYSVFAKDPMNGEEGRRYRHAVLEKGGSRDEMDSLKDFLGREPESAAFYKELGLDAN